MGDCFGAGVGDASLLGLIFVLGEELALAEGIGAGAVFPSFFRRTKISNRVLRSFRIAAVTPMARIALVSIFCSGGSCGNAIFPEFIVRSTSMKK